MSDIRLLALDMDGTTLTTDKEITEETGRMIQEARAAGVKVIFATGRGLPQVVKFREQLELGTAAVLLNGGEVWANDKELLERHHLAHEDLESLHQLAVQYNTSFWGYTTEGRVRTKDWTAEHLQKDWMKFGFYSTDHEVIKHIMDTVTEWGRLEVTSSDWTNIEVNPKGVTKATGVKRLCQALNIGMDQVMAMGDSLNDLALFREAGLSIAVANAHDELKAIADDLTDTNNQNGVAKAIQKYIL